MKYTEVKGNLFNADRNYVLAHCISANCRMEAGIATQFVRRNPRMRESLLAKSPKVGDVLFYHSEKDRVFNMITKEKHYDKPTREDFNKTIVKLKEEMIENEFHHLAIPLIGSGLDKLNWTITEEFIMKEFADTGIEIKVYRL